MDYCSRLLRILLGRTTQSPKSPANAIPPRIASMPMSVVSLVIWSGAGPAHAPRLFHASHYRGRIFRGCYPDVKFVLHLRFRPVRGPSGPPIRKLVLTAYICSDTFIPISTFARCNQKEAQVKPKLSHRQESIIQFIQKFTSSCQLTDLVDH